MPQSGQSRAVIDAVRPCVDGGRFPVKRVVGEAVRVEADIVSDGHDHLGSVLLYRKRGQRSWGEVRMRELPNDLWVAEFTPSEMGEWEYAVRAWIDPFETWRLDLRKRVDAGQDVTVDLEIGVRIIRRTAEQASPKLSAELDSWAQRLASDESQVDRARLGWGDALAGIMWDAAPRRHAVESRPLRVVVERTKALFSAWYEMFPRSACAEPGRHGTFADVEKRLPYVAEAGFDVLYLPPIHPIGQSHRKGRNNAPTAAEGDVGSCWAIGSKEGGHKSIHPELGTIDDFGRLVESARELGIEMAMDLAYQCSRDHPYVREHPEWFLHRPDGTIQYAENPPKKYQDIYPFDFECEDWRALWEELKSIPLYWIKHGIRIFRVDNPHTKPMPFWDWLIAEVSREHPDTIFLSEAFTRPKKMYRLAKGGFTQSYTYIAWRNGPQDLREYLEELTSPPVCDFFRPNFWPNTPDILTAYLQEGGRPAAMARLVLAATLSSSYGIYGPVFELCDFTPRGPGIEENLDSEKYQIRHWRLDDPWSLMPFISLVNRIRRENPALQQFRDITFHHCDNPAHVAYSKRARGRADFVGTLAAGDVERDADDENVILCVVNTNPFEEQWGCLRLNLAALGVDGGASFTVCDLLSGARYVWHGPDNVVGLPPGQSHIFRIEKASRSERDFETWA